MLSILVFVTFFASVRAAPPVGNEGIGNSTSNGTQQVGWISSRPGRSTSEIIWSCFAVLLVCTYKCVHLNLPSLEETEAGWHYVFGVPIWPERPLLRKSLRQLKWMAIILVAPELGVAIAYREHETAKAATKKILPGQKVSLSHGFFAQMGGFVAIEPTPSRFDDLCLSELDPSIAKSSREFLTLEEYIVQCENNNELVATEAGLLDRSKADVFTKIFAIVQSTWLVTQCISRKVIGLPITELELATIAYIMCALAMYLLWWNKPFGVEQPIIVSKQVIRNERHMARRHLIDVDQMWELVIPEKEEQEGIRGGQVVFYLSATIFSAIHLFAWNWMFPNRRAAMAWRVCALVATGSGPILLANTFFIHTWERVFSEAEWLEGVAVTVVVLCSAAYMVARVGLWVLILYSFVGMPVDVYKTVEWSEYLPHFS